MSDITEKELSKLPMVAHIENDDRVVINRGREHGITMGQRFLVFQIGEQIIDPRTKEVLGRLESVRGTGKVSHLQDKMAVIQSDMKVPGPKRTKKPYPQDLWVLRHLSGQFIEEEQSPPIEIGFTNPTVGDYAKPI